MFKIISIGLASIIFIASIFLCGEINGFRLGGDAMIFTEGVKRLEFSGGVGMTVYSVIMLKYALIATLMYLYLIGKLRKITIISTLLSVAAVGVAMVPYWQMIQYKRSLIDSRFTYNDWLLKSLKFDWAFFVVVISLFVLETFFIARTYIASKNHLRIGGKVN